MKVDCKQRLKQIASIESWAWKFWPESWNNLRTSGVWTISTALNVILISWEKLKLRRCYIHKSENEMEYLPTTKQSTSEIESCVHTSQSTAADWNRLHCLDGSWPCMDSALCIICFGLYTYVPIDTFLSKVSVNALCNTMRLFSDPTPKAHLFSNYIFVNLTLLSTL